MNQSMRAWCTCLHIARTAGSVAHDLDTVRCYVLDPVLPVMLQPVRALRPPAVTCITHSKPRVLYFTYTSHRERRCVFTRHGLAWYGMVLHGMVWHGMVWYRMVWYGMVWYGMVWYGMVWYGMVWYGMAWHGMVCMAWYGMVWHGRGRQRTCTAVASKSPLI